MYIQAARDRKDEVQDAFDAIHPAIGGRPGDGYHVGVYDPEEQDYIEAEASTEQDALATVEAIVEDHALPYDVPDDPASITVQERDWE